MVAKWVVDVVVIRGGKHKGTKGFHKSLFILSRLVSFKKKLLCLLFFKKNKHFLRFKFHSLIKERMKKLLVVLCLNIIFGGFSFSQESEYQMKGNDKEITLI